MKVSVIVAHPDDEVLGCGGTIAKHVQNGDEVRVDILAEGLTSRANRADERIPPENYVRLQEQAILANQALGVESVHFHGFPDNRMDHIDLLEITKIVESVIGVFQPRVIYTHHEGDLNIDHQRTNQAVVTASRFFANSFVKRVLFFEVPSSSESQISDIRPIFNPNWYVNINPFLDTKLKALEHYSAEMREWPHPRSIRGVKCLAEYRGLTIGKEYCEAFVMSRCYIE